MFALSVEVWAGGDGLSAYLVCGEGVSAAEQLAAPGKVALLAAAGEHVLAACRPGVFVYQYSVSSKQVTARLDCSKLAPCSESLQSIAIDERLAEDRCMITAMCTLRGEVYVGTAWGCIVVADAASLRPLTVFRPYEEECGSSGGAHAGVHCLLWRAQHWLPD
ncbi:hypothetical protein RR46_01224 [Papilio xuthus]|uniref:Uncharacterized protein n=1 Tax=Papilio xuthus TaxID=66420 RepID=A0A0N0PA55_PAPXU|nr:hypothetical protein RR46_01224 [Papilio xuthus]